MYYIRLFIYAAAVILCMSAVSAADEYQSSRYTLDDARVVISGGRAGSLRYSLEGIEIGNLFGGRAQSANYILDTESIDPKNIPGTPACVSLKSPTNDPYQTLRGTKDRATSIYIDGYEKIRLDDKRVWGHDTVLTEGLNMFVVTSRDSEGVESGSAFLDIVLDTIPPDISMAEKYEGSVITEPCMRLKGTIDDKPFTREEMLRYGKNRLTIEARDEAENQAVENISVYRARRPIPPPAIK